MANSAPFSGSLLYMKAADAAQSPLVDRFYSSSVWDTCKIIKYSKKKTKQNKKIFLNIDQEHLCNISWNITW